MTDCSDSGSEFSDVHLDDERFGSDKEEPDILDGESIDGSFVKGGKKAPIADDDDEFSDGDGDEDDVSFDEEDENPDNYFGGKMLKQDEKKTFKTSDATTLAKASILQSMKDNARKREMLQNEEEIPDEKPNAQSGILRGALRTGSRTTALKTTTKSSTSAVKGKEAEKDGGALKPTSKLQFLKEQKRKLEQIKVDGEPKLNYHQSYKDIINRKLGIKVTTIDIKLREDLEKYVHLCLLSDYQISEVVASCKEHYQLTGLRVSGDEEFIQMYDDDCNLHDRIMLKVPVVLFDNFAAIQKQLNDYFQ